MKKITNILLFFFLTTLIAPTIKCIFDDENTIESICEKEKSEKESDTSEEKEIEKNELEFFDKILFTENIHFTKIINLENEITSHFLVSTTTQFKEIFSPPPELA